MTSVSLGKFSLQGTYDDDLCSLTLQSIRFFEPISLTDLPELVSITSLGYSFRYPEYVIAESRLGLAENDNRRPQIENRSAARCF